MGCGNSSQAHANSKAPTVGERRRRLSVGDVEGQGEEAGDEREEDRGLMSNLKQKNIVEMLNDMGTGDRKMSIGSNTDQAKTSFANKSMEKLGDSIDAVSCGLGFTCRKGLKPESPNQDSWSILRIEGEQHNCSIYCVMDGHGQKGHDVSQFVKENLPKLIVKDSRFKTADMPTMLKDTFKKCQNLIMTADRMKKLSAQMSGTTATVAVHDHGQNKITMAHVADSTAVLGKIVNKEITAVQLTRDHKPNLKDERARIEKNGGRVVFDGYANHRIYAKNARYPGLNMSRCLGDLMGHADCGIIAEPEVTKFEIDKGKEILLLCSDGVW